ncbi:MAG: hypothetical protein ACOYON_10500 [Fimbriimonas sp.]
MSPFSLVLTAAALQTAAPEPVWVIDTVLVAPGKKEVVFDYYRSAWLPARKEALRTKLILDYNAVLLDEDPKEGLRMLLMTKFPSRKDIDSAEPSWQKILKKVAPNGATLPPDLKSSDIRTIVRSDRGVEPFPRKRGR